MSLGVYKRKLFAHKTIIKAKDIEKNIIIVVVVILPAVLYIYSEWKQSERASERERVKNNKYSSLHIRHSKCVRKKSKVVFYAKSLFSSELSFSTTHNFLVKITHKLLLFYSTAVLCCVYALIFHSRLLCMF